ncbi:Cystathionine beta-lyase [Neolecta irregularis DAH-3]|uniref:Cystathionine beta-lyase n=1 Tax=Neolecta irregularis (strain DAH-3) TaxID=1198029 RepID=A0A1U7LHL9_NEOID|nr:Cystathionine beta-lyase [Neolecta irregularis DAH-3]|eukprot:OLL22021.1 Cystathionine beta-lyase [Neolecta irregularis DAH-3]
MNPHLESQFPLTPSPESPRDRLRYNIATELVYVDNPDNGASPHDRYNASSMPIYQTATFKQNSATQMGEYDYTRSGNPTRSHLERHLAKIMNANRALVVSSGMAALDVITRLLKPGDEVVAGNDLYGGTLLYLSASNNKGQTVYSNIYTTDPEEVRPRLTENTAFVLLETPTNPMIKIADIPSISTIVHEKCSRAIVVVDNTMLSPYLQSPLDLGADISYESGTKYLSGHHDLMAGVIAVNNLSLAERLFFSINASGCGLSPFDSWLLMRGVKTLAVRMEKQQSNAIQIAKFLESHGLKTHYPGLLSHPQFKLHHSMARGPGAVLSFETGNATISERIVEGTRIWGISVSFGCVNSLISMPCKMSHASIDPETRAKRALPEDLIRLCVGIEDADDLIQDLQTALIKANALKISINGCHAPYNLDQENDAMSLSVGVLDF